MSLELALETLSACLPETVVASRYLVELLCSGRVRATVSRISTDDNWGEPYPKHGITDVTSIAYLNRHFWNKHSSDIEVRSNDTNLAFIQFEYIDNTWTMEDCEINSLDLFNAIKFFDRSKVDSSIFDTGRRRGRKKDKKWAVWIAEAVAMAAEGLIYPDIAPNAFIEQLDARLLKDERHAPGLEILDRSTVYSAAEAIIARLRHIDGGESRNK